MIQNDNFRKHTLFYLSKKLDEYNKIIERVKYVQLQIYRMNKGLLQHFVTVFTLTYPENM